MPPAEPLNHVRPQRQDDGEQLVGLSRRGGASSLVIRLVTLASRDVQEIHRCSLDSNGLAQRQDGSLVMPFATRPKSFRARAIVAS